jgi:hypothetical protein
VRGGLAILIGLYLLALPVVALADGDPASDVLLQEKVYFPTQRVSAQAANSLKHVVQEANAKGYRVRVALIHDESDLGTVPGLLNQPQRYAQFLGPEIRFIYKGNVLVVMPDGLGLAATDGSAPPARAIAGMQVEAGGLPDGLALTAQEAVIKLAAAAGHPIVTAKKSGDGGGGGGGTAIGAIVAAVLLVAGIGAAFLVRRNQPQAP